MTWQPGSVNRKPGHILIRGTGLKQPIRPSKWLSVSTAMKFKLLCGFLTVNNTCYYINGRSQVYETDIIRGWGVYFRPVVWQYDPARLMPRQVLFRKMHKLEWLFS